MSTHGRILVRDTEKPKATEITLYAWHDGHDSQAVKDYAEMPLILFRRAREAAKWAYGDQKGLRATGPWHYQVIMSVKGDREERATEAEFNKSWPCFGYVDLSAIGLANWHSFMHFDRWTIVPSLKFCSYPGDRPDLIVTLVDDGRLSGAYTVEHTREMEDDEMIEVGEEMAGIAAAANKELGWDAITVKGLVMTVPFVEITRRLLWQELQLAYAVIDGKNTDPEHQWMKCFGPQPKEESAMMAADIS